MKKILSLIAIGFIAIGCGSKSDVETARADLGFGSSIGSICGSDDILGTKEKRIRNGGCGISSPVKVYAVSGVKLSSPALVNCKTATTLNDWVKNSLKPEARSINKTVSDIEVMGAYSCRTRNHRKGAKLSEHSFGNAIDIGGFSFTDGSRASILTDYSTSFFRRFMRKIRKGACGPFGTVLGPGTDRLHANHFHFDVARYSMGAYCK